MSGQLLGGVAGAGLAFVTEGASVGMGWALGGVVGGILAPGKPTGNGPRLADLRPQSSEYGRPIPIVYGHTGLGGNVIWATDFIVDEASVGGKGGGGAGATMKSYYANFAVAVCEGEHQIARIWAGPMRRLVFDGITFPTTWGLRLYNGTGSQMPDPLIQSDKGVGHAPAYRGTVYAVFERFPLKDDGNMIPELWIELGAVLDKGDCPPPCAGYPSNQSFATAYSAAGYAPWSEYETLTDRFWTFSNDGSGVIMLTDAPTLTTNTITLVLGDGHFARSRYSPVDKKMWIANGQRMARVDCTTLNTDFIVDVGTGWALATSPNDMAVDPTTGDVWVLAQHSGSNYILQLTASGAVAGQTLIGIIGTYEAIAGNLIVDNGHRCWFSRGATIAATTLPIIGFVPAHRGTDRLWRITAGTTVMVDAEDNYLCVDADGTYVRILRMSHDSKRNAIWMWVQQVGFNFTTHVETSLGSNLIRYDIAALQLRFSRVVDFGTDYLFGYDIENDLCWLRSGTVLYGFCGATGAVIQKSTISGAMGDRSIPLVRPEGVGPQMLYYDKPGSPYALGKYDWDEVSRNGLDGGVAVVSTVATADGGWSVPDDYTWSVCSLFNRARNSILVVTNQGFYRDIGAKEYDATTGLPTGVQWVLPGGSFGTIHTLPTLTAPYDHLNDRFWSPVFTYGAQHYTGTWDAYKYDGTLVASASLSPNTSIVRFTVDTNTGDCWVSFEDLDPITSVLIGNYRVERRSGVDFSLLETFTVPTGLGGAPVNQTLAISSNGDCYFLAATGAATNSPDHPGGSPHWFVTNLCVARKCSGGIVQKINTGFSVGNIAYDSVHNAIWCWDNEKFFSRIHRFDLDTMSVGASCVGDTGADLWTGMFNFDEVNNILWVYIEDAVVGSLTGLFNVSESTTPHDPDKEAIVGFCGNDGHIVHLHFAQYGGASYPGTSDGSYSAHLCVDSWYANKASGASIFFIGTVDNTPVGSVLTGPFDRLTEYHWDIVERPIIKDVPVTLGQIVADISYRVNLTPQQIDVSQLPDIVDGFAVAKQTPARDAIEVLRPLWQFDPVESGAKVKWVKRGVTLSATIPDADLAARHDTDSRPEDRITLRQMEHDLPFRLNVQYLQAAMKYQPAMKHQQRYRSRGAFDSTLDTPVTMTDAKAQEAADTNLYQAWTERTHLSFTLPAKKYVALEPTDVVLVAGYTVRLVKMTYNLAGVVSCDALVENPTYYQESHVMVTETVSGDDPLIDPARAALVTTTLPPAP